MDLARWLGFLGLSTAAVLTPGPTLLAIVGHAAGSGVRATIPVVIGNALGIAVLMGISIAGVAGALLRAPGLLLALQLASYQTTFGDWRELFREVERIDKVSAADVKRVANEVFVPSQRTVAKIESTKPTAAAPASGTSGGTK